jgi:hypothetical protein
MDLNEMQIRDTDGPMIHLTRTVGDKNIWVSCMKSDESPDTPYPPEYDDEYAPTEDDYYPDEDDDSDLDRDEMKDMMPPSEVPIRVTVTKGEQSLAFSCIYDDSIIRVQEVAVSTFAPEKLHQPDTSMTDFLSPNLSDLDDALRDAFRDYLKKDLGVDTDVADFLSKYGEYKAQKQKIQFLEKAKEILAP